jgi:hypothetical protein
VEEPLLMSPAHRERVKPVRRLSNGKAWCVSIESLGRKTHPAGQIHLAAGSAQIQGVSASGEHNLCTLMQI